MRCFCLASFILNGEHPSSMNKKKAFSIPIKSPLQHLIRRLIFIAVPNEIASKSLREIAIRTESILMDKISVESLSEVKTIKCLIDSSLNSSP